jgi:hypothetical protein
MYESGDIYLDAESEIVDIMTKEYGNIEKNPCWQFSSKPFVFFSRD